MGDTFHQAIKSALQKNADHLNSWVCTTESVRREENYLIQDAREKVALDQNRSVEDIQYNVFLSVRKEGGKIGTIEEVILPHQDPAKALEKLIEKAHLSTEDFWTLPLPSEATLKLPRVYDSVYPGFRADLSLGAQTLVDDLRGSIVRTKDAEFNSAEVFVSVIHRNSELSSGLQFEHTRSKIYTEVCFSSRDGRQSDEFLVTRMGVQPNELDLPGLCAESATGARALLQADRTPSGTYAVQVDGEVLGQIFSDAITHLDAEQKYFQLPYIERGSDFIAAYKGVDFELGLDPSLQFGMGSRQFSWDGLPQNPLPLVRSNKVQSNLVSGQMGQYMRLDSTTTAGNLVITAKGEDPSLWHRSQPVLEILQFSALFSSPRDLTFSSEIRLARILREGQAPLYVRGGNFSGRFAENLRELKLSNQPLVRCLNEESLGYSRTYSGPHCGLLNNVQITS